MNRRCKRCKEVKGDTHFSRDATRSTGHFPYCKSCQMQTTTAFQDEDQPLNGFTCPLDGVPIRGHKNRRFCSLSCKERVAALRLKYGMDVADYLRLIEATGGVCPICLKRPTVWQVDHDHRTRMAVGVVCLRCNVGSLASTYHDTAYVERLLDYLKHTPCDRLGIVAQAPEGKTQPSNLHKVWGHQAKRRKSG